MLTSLLGIHLALSSLRLDSQGPVMVLHRILSVSRTIRHLMVLTVEQRSVRLRPYGILQAQDNHLVEADQRK